MRSVLLILLCGILAGWSCSMYECSVRSREASRNQNLLNTMQARLEEESQKSHYPSQQLRPSEALIRIQMLDNLEGWAGARDATLFKTKNGTAWEKTGKVSLPDNAYLTDFFFVASHTGWLSLARAFLHFDEKTKQGTYDIGTWLFRTSDGGNTWKEALFWEGSQILQVRFLNADEGWAVGRRLSKHSGETDSNFIIYTSDGGNSWQDLSAKLPADVGVLRIAFLRPSSITVITGNGLLLSTVDKGSSWQQISSYQYEQSNISIHQLITSAEQRFCILAGRGGTEGTLSKLSCLDSTDGWKGYVLPGVFLNDLISLPDGTLLACGFLVKEGDLLGAGGEAMLISSSDHGKTWSVLYRNPDVSSLNALSAIDSEHVWAAGASGLVVSTKRPAGE